MEENTQYGVKRAAAAGSQVRGGQQAYTIDLYQLWMAIIKRFWNVVCAVLIGACIAADITFFLIPATYTSSSMMLVLTKETTLQSIADLQIGTQLTNDYKILIQSRPVLEKVIENLNLDLDYQSLRGMITVTNQDDTRILQLDVVTTDPVMSKKIVDELANVSSAYIGDKMEITAPKVIEEGEIPTQKTSPSITRNTVIGALIGLLAAIAFITVEELMDDTLVTEEDVSQYLGLVTLSVIPERADEAEKADKGRRRKKKLSKKRDKGVA